jgi:hypothetical protein
MQRSESIANLADALAKAQGVMQSVKKDRSARIDTKAGSSYSYAYADLASVLEAIRKPLSDNGLALIQASSIANGYVEVETLLAHTSGDWVSNTLALPASNLDPRSLGSLITYGRRYGLALVGVVTDEDDDGAGGSRPGEQRQRTKTEVKTQTQPRPAQPAPDNGHAKADADFAAMQSRSATAAPAMAPAANGKVKPCNITHCKGFAEAVTALVEKHESAGVHTGYKTKAGYDYTSAQYSLGALGYTDLTTEQLPAAMSALEGRIMAKLEAETAQA